MKKARRVLCVVLTLALFLFIPMKANALETRASLYLSSYIAYVYPEGDGKVSVWFEVQATHTMDEVGVLTIRLREKAPGSSTWTPVKTYSYTDEEYEYLLKTNVAHHDGHVDYQGKEGYSYFAYVTVWAGDNGDGDSRIIETDPVVAK